LLPPQFLSLFIQMINYFLLLFSSLFHRLSIQLIHFRLSELQVTNLDKVIMQLLQLLILVLFLLNSLFIPYLHDFLESNWIIKILAADNVGIWLVSGQFSKHWKCLLSVFSLSLGKQEDFVGTLNEFLLLWPQLRNGLDLLLDPLVFEAQDNDFMLQNGVF
jgi:hypothetical protein